MQESFLQDFAARAVSMEGVYRQALGHSERGEEAIAYRTDHLQVSLYLTTGESLDPGLREIQSISITSYDSSGNIQHIREFATEDGSPLPSQFATTVARDALDVFKHEASGLSYVTSLARQEKGVVVLDTIPEFGITKMPSLQFDLRAKHQRQAFTPLYEVRDPRLGINTRYKLLTTDGIAQIPEKIRANGLMSFHDKDNMGLINDVGLDELNDYLLECQVAAFERHLGDAGEQIRYGGDEFVYVFENTDEAQAAFQAYLEEVEEITERALQGQDLPAHLADIPDFEQRIAQARELAVIKRVMSQSYDCYRRTVKQPESLEFGNWLREQYDEDLFEAWRATLETDAILTDQGFTEISGILGGVEGDLDVLVHSYQAFVAMRALDLLRDGLPGDASEGLIRLNTQFELAQANSKLMGDSVGVVELPRNRTGNFGPYDVLRGIATVEKRIANIKRGRIEKTLVPQEIEDLRIRREDKDEINRAQARVLEHEDLASYILRVQQDSKELGGPNAPTLSAPRDDFLVRSLMERLFVLSCSDPGAESMLRADLLGEAKARAVLPQIGSAWFEFLSCKVNVVSAANKANGMQVGDRMMDETARALVAGDPEARAFRTGGAQVIVARPDRSVGRVVDDISDELRAKLAEQVRERLSPHAVVAFHEKQAFKMLATSASVPGGERRYSHYKDLKHKPELPGEVTLSVIRRLVDVNHQMSKTLSS
ncbi:MAG: hypothetical protein H6619_06540 [Deltaproteobacteria bacterium]|nr:hypothetical protein [Deltaproteobacteria bacterium]